MSIVRPIAAALLALTAAWSQAADDDFFESKVRPLLVEHCAECHSSEAGDPEGGLSFDSRADFFSADGVATPGAPDVSLLVKAVRYDGDLQMPPDGKLPATSIGVFEEWVRRGLPWPDDGKAAKQTGFDIEARKAEHWCWQPPRAATPPDVSQQDWCRNDIDRFVLARLEAAKLAPSKEADRGTLVRRASQVLTGLPPDPSDLARVVADDHPEAFEKYVDALLASRHYGERFARHWLDVVRFAESRGHEFDFPIPNAWRYRDWVIEAFNDDLPYDQFVREQIAGDLMETPRIDASGANRSVVGTGFWYLGEEVHSPVDLRQDEADRTDNRVDTFGKAFLGMALGCARCHDHKFDAISAADYYAIAGMVMSSSYRQVPYETLEHNRGIAAEAAADAARSHEEFLRLTADVLTPHRDEFAKVIASLLNPRPETRGKAEDAVSETVLADYTRGAAGSPIICDAAAWRSVAPGEPVLDAVPDSGSFRVHMESHGYATSDPVWATTKTRGDKEAGAIGSVERAGRVLRTPKVRVSQGVLWHRVRGHMQIVTTVDSHVLIHGPLYAATVMKVDTKGQWEWIRQDLRRDIDWSAPHVVHVEYAAIAGGVDVAEAVAAPEKPARSDPLVTLNTLLASPAIDWAQGPAKRLAEEVSAAKARRDAIYAKAKLESATAPAILDGNGLDQFILLKGSAARPGKLAARRFLEAIDGRQQPVWPANSSGRRELADRVLDPANPLTARVAVNRIWHHLFGRGLVPTTDNFGKLGEPTADPIAQALLDTLAVRFMEEGWSVKRLVREIVTSSAWRMASTRDPAAHDRDPLNLLLHHYPLRRLEGEAIRDTILAVSGRLDHTVGGRGVEVFLTDFQEGRGVPKSGPLDGNGRRSIYITVRRNFMPSFLAAFDLPVPFQAMGRRNVTNVPAQALTMMNDAFVAEQARAWAKRILEEPSTAPEGRIDAMIRCAFARPATPSEIQAALAFLREQARAHGKDFAVDPRHEAAWADFAHALLNTKEFIFLP